MRKVSSKVLRLPPAIYMILVLSLYFGFTTTGFFDVSNLTNILNQSATLLLLACGQTIVVLLQGTDLSLGYQISVVSVLWIFLLNAGVPMVPAILLAIIAGVIMGLVNGFFVAKLQIPIFIVTLATSNIFKSIALLVSDGNTLYYSSDIYAAVAKTNYLGLPLSTWIAFAGFLLTLFLLRKTTLGIRIRALGGNAEALRLAGTNTNINIIKAFAYCGFMAGISGFVLACRVASGNPLGGEGYEFNAVAAVLLGGSSMREGNGGVGGTLFGVWMLQLFRNGLNIAGVSSLYQNFLIGAIVIVALIIDALIKKRQEI